MKKLLFFLLLPFSILAQTPDATIKTNTNNLIRNSTNVTRANHSLINDQITDSKESRIRPFIASGTNTYTVAIPYVTSYLFGLTVYVQFTNANSGTSTINITGASGSPLGAKTLKKSVLTDLVTGDILAGEFKELWYDGTNFQVRGAGGGGGGSIVVSSNTTAVNDGVYTVVASATFTDPSPVEGKGFTVFIRNGTATVGGTGYSVAGTKITRIFHSGSWANYVGGGAISGLTSGQVTFATSGTTIGDDSNLFWDNTNKNLGVGTTPDTDARIHIKKTGSNSLLKIEGGFSSDIAAFEAKNSAGGLFQMGKWGITTGAFGSILAGDGYLYSYEPFAITSVTAIKFGSGTSVPERMRLNDTGQLLIGGSTATNSSVLLDLQSTTRAFKLGEATRASITTGANGMLTVDTNVPYFHNGTSWTSLLGITNSAANNELMMSNGTNAVPSGVFRGASLGDLSMGNSLSGTSRIVQAEGSLSDVDLNLSSKGSFGGVFLSSGGGTIYYSLNDFTFQTASAIVSSSGSLTIKSDRTGSNSAPLTLSTGTSTTNGSSNISIATGNSGSSGNIGNISLTTGTPTSGSEGSINIQTRATGKLGFFNITPVVKQSAVSTSQGIADVLTAYGLLPTSTISSGGTYYAPSTLVANATDANFTATVNGVHNILDGVASANRVITIPTGANGDVMKFYNTEDTRVWSFTGATVYLADRVTVVTELLYNVPCHMERIDGRWIITN